MENSIKENETLPPRKPSKAWGSIGILFSAFAFIILIAAFYFAVNYLLIANKKIVATTQALQNEIKQTQNQMGTLNNAEQIKQLQDQLTTQQQNLNEIKQHNQNNNQQWAIAEAYYLVKLANDNLTVGDNLTVVITLLQNADQRIQALNDEKLNPIRQAIAADVAALQALPQIDSAGIYAQLSALNNEVEKLPLPNHRPEVMPTTESPALPWYKRGWHQTVTALKQIVVVRYNKPGEQPFVAPDLQPYLYQNMHSMLTQAMFAVLLKQPEIYQLSLKQAQEWLTKYFLQDAQVTKSMLATITQLQSLPIKNKLPTLEASLSAFQNAANSGA